MIQEKQYVLKCYYFQNNNQFKMRNNYINQNEQKASMKQTSASKVIVKSNGKISLSKSTHCYHKENKKSHEINLLKKQIFKLKCQLEEQKTQNKKIAILSNEIRKVKQRLIRKVSEKNAQKVDQTLYADKQKRKRSKQHTDLQQTVKETISNQQISTPKVSLLRDSTDQIFKNFSLIKSLSKKSSNIRGDQTRQIQGNSKIIYLDQIESLQSRQIIQSILSDRKFKFRSRYQSQLEDKTVKRPSLNQKFKSQQTFFNEFEEYQLSGSGNNNNNVWSENQKLSVTNCINSKRNNKNLKQAGNQ